MTNFSNIEFQSQQVVQKDIKKSLITSGVRNQHHKNTNIIIAYVCNFGVK